MEELEQYFFASTGGLKWAINAIAVGSLVIRCQLRVVSVASRFQAVAWKAILTGS